MKKTLLILFTLFMSVIGYSQSVGDTFFDNFITFEITSLTPNEVKTIGYVVSGGPIVNVPASVINSGNTYTVTSIGTQTFASKNLTSVTLPNSLVNIDDTAFTNNALTSITIPNSVSSIGYAAFGVNSITSVIIPDSVTSLGDSAFDSNALTSVTISNSLSSLGLATFANNNLSTVTIPSSITAIGNSVFSNNPLTCVISEGTTPATIASGSTTDSFGGSRSNINLTIPLGTATAYAAETWTGFNSVAEGFSSNFVVDHITYQVTSTTNNTVKTSDYNTAGGTVVNIPSTVTRACTTYSVTEIGVNSFAQNNLTSVTIPTSVTSIGFQAFANNANLTSAPLHNGITSIGHNAFNNCALNSVNIPTSMVTIEDGTFVSNNITSVTIPSNITSIGSYAFRFNNLTSINIPDTVSSIGIYAFANNNISNATLPNSLTTIPEGTFDFNSLSSITIPSTVTVIGENAFRSNNFATVTIPDGVTTLELGAFSQNVITNVTIPNSVTSIGILAFRLNQLTAVTIPENVTFIGERAFVSNPLTDVTSLANVPPTITTSSDFPVVIDSFNNDRSDIHLHIPAGTMGAYVTDSGALWTGFNPVTEDASLGVTDFELTNNIKVINTKDELRVISSGNVKLKRYNIYAITGAKIKDGKESIIAIDNFSNGIYILELNFDEGKLLKKFAK
ncbi:leucine-rich repeat domain-containing protein [Algibacter luteus]|uniref:leucine-rich repeat domain-containing protein n=1 Tax=Algibacter luteus TaxID=1178825 RepID=UPI002599F41E|nr:leucine-rich repeat domain-containing protein [Algibacter luteus]WJJ95418.1 leucine-rich repeat domain-containing protein [Algibacter luteus]